MPRRLVTVTLIALLAATLLLARVNAAPPTQITIAVPSDIVSMDPHATSDFVTNQVMTGTVYETLVKVGTKGEYEPALAVSWKILDNQTWEFRLRPNVKFHNGEPLTADAVKFSLDRCLNPANRCPRRGQLSVAQSVEVVDPMTVRIKTEGAFAALPSALMFGFIVAPRAVQTDPQALQKQAIGTGAMRLVEWQRGQRLVFERFNDYWGKKPQFERVIYRPIPDEIARVAALQAGEVHLVTAMPPEMVPVLTRNPKTAVARRGQRQIYIGMDATGTNLKPLADVRVRQAMNYAVNKDVLVSRILEGNAVPNVGGMFPQAPGFDTRLRPYPHDPGRAKRLLAEAGYADGFEVTLNFVPGLEGSLKTKEVVESVASDLGNVGIRVRLVQMEAAAFWDGYFGKKYQMYLLTWGTSPEAGLYYRTLLHSRTRGLYYRNSKTDELIDAWFAALEPRQRVETGRVLHRHVYEQAPFIFLFNQFSLFGMSASLTWVERPIEVIWAYDLGWQE
ncbi:MAG: ABC transporter substrate-binding protein [Armatimonadota bacterium]|nr:ABC transporter substrate-binding protein [Armatimonadota bacterium]